MTTLNPQPVIIRSAPNPMKKYDIEYGNDNIQSDPFTSLTVMLLYLRSLWCCGDAVVWSCVHNCYMVYYYELFFKLQHQQLTRMCLLPGSHIQWYRCGNSSRISPGGYWVGNGDGVVVVWLRWCFTFTAELSIYKCGGWSFTLTFDTGRH